MSDWGAKTEADVFVIGGGPAGLAAALAARHAGMRVIVADGSEPPIDKACGEGLMPDSRTAAAALGIKIPTNAGHEFRGIRFVGAGRSVSGDFPEGRGLGVRRTKLHALMIEAAEEAGIEMRWKTPVSGLSDINARWIIGADGAGSRVRRWVGLEEPVRNSMRFAYRRHFAIQPWSEFVEVWWAHQCQIYVTPIADHEVCLALIAREPAVRLDQALERHFPALHDRLSGAESASRERGAITASMKLRRVAHGNVALIGDASGSVDAITGEGLCLAFRQAHLLARALAAGNLELYNREHPRIALRPHLMARLMLLLDRGEFVRSTGLKALSAVPSLFQKLLEVHVGA
jgi:flavin-dependent dehydrogenase